MGQSSATHIALMVVLGLVGFLVISSLFIGIWAIGGYNGLVQQDVSVAKSWGSVQTAYERRLDLIPNLVATVKGSASFEKDTLTQIAAFRSGINAAKTPAQLEQVNTETNNLIGRIQIQYEQYPTLQTTEQFRALMDELAGTENRIKFERDNYNTEVQNYQQMVRVFPTNLLAGMFGFKVDKWDMFAAKQAAQDAPVVSFQ